MDAEQIKQVLESALALDEVHVKTDGSHIEVIAVGQLFDGMRSVKRQQTIYAPLMDKIADGTIHAVSIKAYSSDEWQRQRKLESLG